MKMALRNFSGKPVRYYVVNRTVAPVPTPVSSPTHHICVLDVSGSMYVDLDSVKSVVEKVFTAEEFNNPASKVSLLTYASNGDCRVHFQRVSVADVMAPNSPQLREIRNLRTRGMTGISQALIQAEKLVDDTEVTCVSLHTDGYANDPSPFSESQSLLKAVDSLARHPNLFCNTVGYRDYCDFALLAMIANRLSGQCLRASSAKQVYDSLYGAQKTLSGQVSPALELGLDGADFITVVSRQTRRVLGGTSPLTIRGLKAEDDVVVYRYKEVSEADFNASSEEESFSGQEALLAFCRVQIALGNLNLAKYAMVSTQMPLFLQSHAKALVASDVAYWTEDVDMYLFDNPACMWRRDFYGLKTDLPSVVSVLQKLQQFKTGLRVNVDQLAGVYKRRGLKRVAGTRDENGRLVPPKFQLETDAKDWWASVASIEVNRDTATANIKLVRDAQLVERSTGQVVKEVAGIPLALKEFRAYTVISDGSVNISVLPVKFTDKRLFSWLKEKGLVDGDFNPSMQYDLRLDHLPLVDYDQDFQGIPAEKFKDLVQLTVLQKILAALVKNESVSYTPEQVAALKEHNLTPALYFSAPTTTPYADLQAAILAGEVDTRTSYKVKVGIPSILNVGELFSGNAYFQRRFVLTGADGVEIPKPTLDMLGVSGVTWAVKALSARTKLTEVDAITYPIYADFLGVGATGALERVLILAGLDSEQRARFHQACAQPNLLGTVLDVFSSTAEAVDAAIAAIYAETITPLAFYVGATGLVPDSFNGVAMTADQLVVKYPEVSLGKAEKEGLFYEIPGGTILSVFSETAYYSTPKGVKAAQHLVAVD